MLLLKYPSGAERHPCGMAGHLENFQLKAVCNACPLAGCQGGSNGHSLQGLLKSFPPCDSSC